jgi:hypothetical protein
MAYGKRYLLQQALRDDSKLLINIYEDGYTGSVYNYEAVSVSLSPNSNSDEPEPGIISSQLNISFLMSTATDNSNFPDLLTYNDKLYYVELTRIASTGGENVVWRGYTFNDYVTVPFSTGTTQVDIICIDALSFMKNNYYPYTASSNGLQNLYTVLAEGLNLIGYPNSPSLYQCCSYFGSSMANRGASAANEPFSQTYIYKRDLQQNNYYDLIEKIAVPLSLKTGAPVGEWHLVVGNPMNPVAMIGNLVCRGVQIEFGEVLGPDDFPAEIKVTITIEHGMPRDKAGIESMFNKGRGRIYALPKGYEQSLASSSQSPVDTSITPRYKYLHNDNTGASKEADGKTADQKQADKTNAGATNTAPTVSSVFGALYSQGSGYSPAVPKPDAKK